MKVHHMVSFSIAHRLGIAIEFCDQYKTLMTRGGLRGGDKKEALDFNS